MSDVPPLPPYPPRVAASAPEQTGKKRILGIPAWLAISLSVFGAIVLLSAIGVVGVNLYTDRKEAIADARASFQAAFESYETAEARLAGELEDAELALESFEAEDLDDGSLLDDLDVERGAAQAVFDESSNRAEFDVSAGSVGEVTAEAESVEIAASDLDAAADALDDAEQRVRDSFDAKVEAEAAEREAEREAEAEEKAKKEATSISYEELFRSGSSLSGEYFKFQGKIVQAIGSNQYRVNVTKEPGYSMDFWEDTVLLTVDPEAEVKLLEDDIISFTARSSGTVTYETIMGASVEIPAVVADGADVSLDS